MMASLLAGGPGPLGARLWRTYESCLERRPVATQSITSAVLWGCGDLLAQKLCGCSDSSTSSSGGGKKNGGSSLDLRRTALTAAFGGAFIGPAGSWFYSNLDKFAALFGSEGSARFLLAKLVADSTAWNICYMSAFFLWGELVIERGNLRDFCKQMQEEFVPTYLAEVAAWPPVMAAIFTRLPVSHHLLAVNLVTVLDVAFLAVVRSGAFSLGGAFPPVGAAAASAVNATSSQGEELCDEPTSEEPAGGGRPPPRNHQQHQHQHHPLQHQHFLVPALASMHTSGGSSSSTGSCGSGGSFAGSGQASKQQSLIEQWVLPEHRPAQPQQADEEAAQRRR